MSNQAEDWDVEERTAEEQVINPPPPKASEKPAEEKAEQPQSTPPLKSAYRFTRTPQPKATHPGDKFVTPARREVLLDGFPKEFDENFPNDLTKCFSILKSVDNLPQRNQGEINEKARRRKVLGKHILKLQDPMPVIHLNSEHIAELRQQKRNRPQIRAQRIEDIKSLLAEFWKDILESENILSNPDALGETDAGDDTIARQLLAVDPKDRLFVHKDIRYLINIARIHALNAELFSLENHDLCYPIDHLEELEHELRNCRSVDRVRELQQLIASAKERGSNRANEVLIKQEAANKWNPFFDIVKILIPVAGKLLARWGIDAAVAEHEFFAELGFQPEETSISRRYLVLLDELDKLTVTKNSLNWFGVSNVTEF